MIKVKAYRVSTKLQAFSKKLFRLPKNSPFRQLGIWCYPGSQKSNFYSRDAPRKLRPPVEPLSFLTISIREINSSKNSYTENGFWIYFRVWVTNLVFQLWLSHIGKFLETSKQMPANQGQMRRREKNFVSLFQKIPTRP